MAVVVADCLRGEALRVTVGKGVFLGVCLHTADSAAGPGTTEVPPCSAATTGAKQSPTWDRVSRALGPRSPDSPAHSNY